MIPVYGFRSDWPGPYTFWRRRTVVATPSARPIVSEMLSCASFVHPYIDAGCVTLDSVVATGRASSRQTGQRGSQRPDSSCAFDRGSGDITPHLPVHS